MANNNIKYFRNYILTVTGSNNQPVQILPSNMQNVNGNISIVNPNLPISPTFTLEFDITRNTLTSCNVASIRIMNLNPNTRALLRKDITDLDDYRLITLQAGYGSNYANWPVIFTGNVTQAWSVREGDTFVTSLESFDGGFAVVNAKSSGNFLAGTTYQKVILMLCNDLINANGNQTLSMGYIGNFPGTLSKGRPYSGTTISLIQEITGGAVFIDLGKINVLGNNEILPGQLLVIDSSVGLLGTPVRQQTIVDFDIVFEPRIVVGQELQVNSSTFNINPNIYQTHSQSYFESSNQAAYVNQSQSTDGNLNASWKIVSLKHRGVISGSVAGDAVTSIGMAQGIQAFVLGQQGVI